MGAEERDIDAAVAEPHDDATEPVEPAPAATISRGRLIGVDVLVGVTTLLLVVCVFATWANRLLFSPDNWSKTSTQLLQNQNVRTTTANYIVDQLYANANRAADQTFIDVVNGRKGTVGVNQGAVTLDLASIVNNIASRLGLPSDIA